MNISAEKMKEIIIQKINTNVANLFKFPNDPAQKQKKLEDLADTFIEVYNKAQQHQ